MVPFLWFIALLAGVGAIVWRAEAFAEHLGKAAVALGVICLIALGVGAMIAPLPFSGSALRYALLSLPLGAIGVWFAWDGNVSRPEGAILVILYLAYVALIWIVERHPPTLGEVGELAEAHRHPGSSKCVGRDLIFVVSGVLAMAAGATLLVEAVRRISHIQSTQTKLGLTVVGFATGFELVVLAWSASRRGASEAVVAGVVESFAYNVTMTLGAAALVHPLILRDANQLHLPLLAMLASLGLVIGLVIPRKRLIRRDAIALFFAYGVFIFLALHR